MKLLLTSAGIQNPSLAKAVIELVGKPREEISSLFIPTAANPIPEDKTWLIKNLEDFKEQQYKSIDILDIASLPLSSVEARLETADLICFGGGNEQYLAKVLHDSGLARRLPELLKTRVFMGISAGSMVAGRFLPADVLKLVYPEEQFEERAQPLAYADLLFVPHLNSEHFASVRRNYLEGLRAQFAYPLYACDDNSALKVVNGAVEIIGEGETVLIENT